LTTRSYVKEAVIDVSQAEAFRFCSDLRNEMAWNPNAEQVDKLSDGPVDVGTRFRARWSNAGEVLVEVVEFDPPRSWATRSAARGMEIVSRGEVIADPGGGTRYTAHMEVQPRGLAWIYAPLAVLAMRRQDTINMSLIKQTLESGVDRARPAGARRLPEGRVDPRGVEDHG
jgi:hypothetical protein